MARRHTVDCLHCGAQTSNGLALCDVSRAALLTYLEFVPVYFRNLTRWRPSSTATSRPVPGSREPSGLGAATNDRIGDQLETSYGAIAGWLRKLAEHRPEHAGAVRAMLGLEEEQTIRQGCDFLAEHVDTLATLPWVGDLVRSLAEHEAILREETEQAVPGWYAGLCAYCKVATYVVPGLTWVTCSSCGTSTNAHDHADTILTEARPWLGRGRDLAAVVVALTDETSAKRIHDRIRTWITREKIPTFDVIGRPRRSKYDPAYCRLGDVLDLIAAADRAAAEKAAADKAAAAAKAADHTEKVAG